MRLLWAVVMASCTAVIAASCVSTPPFVCTASDQCSEGGRCERTQFCSFPADDCASSGRRYSELAGAGLAGSCVGEDLDGGAMSDAAPIDLEGRWLPRSPDPAYIAGRDAPVAVSGCVPGGESGRVLVYAESISVSAARTITYVWDYEEAERLGLGVDPMVNADQIDFATLSALFDVDFSVDDSSANVGDGLSVVVPADQFGMSYRQTVHMKSGADLDYQNTSGDLATAGQAVMGFTIWNVEVAVGDSCPPPSTQPPPF